MKASIGKALFNSHPYSEYRKIISDLLQEGLSSGNEQSEELTHYSSLNEARMNRLEKTIKIAEVHSQKLKSLKHNYIWLVISEGWCGDSAQLLPIMDKLAMESNKIELKIVFRDENEELMSQFLTNKSRSIPILIVIDKETTDVLNHWGPRPFGASQLIKDYKAKFGVVDETAKADLQLWYLHDKGISTQNEIMEMMLKLE